MVLRHSLQAIQKRNFERTNKMADTIVVVERGLKWTAYFENAPHKQATDVNRHEAIGELIENYGDHCGIEIRVGTVEDNAVVNGTITYTQLWDDLKTAHREIVRLESENGCLQSLVAAMESSGDDPETQAEAETTEQEQPA